MAGTLGPSLAAFGEVLKFGPEACIAWRRLIPDGSQRGREHRKIVQRAKSIEKPDHGGLSCMDLRTGEGVLEDLERVTHGLEHEPEVVQPADGREICSQCRANTAQSPHQSGRRRVMHGDLSGVGTEGATEAAPPAPELVGGETSLEAAEFAQRPFAVCREFGLNVIDDQCIGRRSAHADGCQHFTVNVEIPDCARGPPDAADLLEHTGNLILWEPGVEALQRSR